MPRRFIMTSSPPHCSQAARSGCFFTAISYSNFAFHAVHVASAHHARVGKSRLGHAFLRSQLHTSWLTHGSPVASYPFGANLKHPETTSLSSFNS